MVPSLRTRPGERHLRRRVGRRPGHRRRCDFRLVSAYGWRTGFVAAGSVGFVWLLAWLLFFDRPDRVSWLGPTEREKILRERDGDPRSRRRSTGSPLAYLLRLRSTWGLFLTQGSEVYGGYMLMTWLPSYLQQAKQLSLMNAGMLTAVPFGVASVFGVALGWISDRLLNPRTVSAGRRRAMIAVMLFGASR